MKFRSIVYVYRTDNKESHPTTNPDSGILPFLHHFQDHNRTSASSTYREHFLHRTQNVGGFLTNGCLQLLKQWDKEGNQKHLRAPAPLIILDSKVLIRIYTTQTDHQGGMFQNLLYLTFSMWSHHYLSSCSDIEKSSLKQENQSQANMSTPNSS